MKNSKETIPLEEALRRLDEALSGFRVDTETVPPEKAPGRFLSEDCFSLLDLPPFDKSAMDGFAVMEGDDRDEYRVVETVPAGKVPVRKLEPGTAVKVMTGAPVPENTGRVVMVEHTEQSGDLVRILRRDPRRNVCLKGEDVKAGDLVLGKGRRLTPADAGNLAACGVFDVPVARKVRVAVICTGGEIVARPDRLRPGGIIDSNGPMLAALSERAGMELVSRETAPDDLQAITQAISKALERADFAVLSGGVSMGDFDFVSEAMERAGLEVRFRRVAVKPGKPVTFACRGPKAAFGLPGNPVSVFLTFHLYVKRAAALVSGAEPAQREFRLPLAGPFRRKRAGRTSFVPAGLTPESALLPLEYHGSAHLAALREADGFFSVPRGAFELKEGARVNFIPLEGLHP